MFLRAQDRARQLPGACLIIPVLSFHHYICIFCKEGAFGHFVGLAEFFPQSPSTATSVCPDAGAHMWDWSASPLHATHPGAGLRTTVRTDQRNEIIPLANHNQNLCAETSARPRHGPDKKYIATLPLVRPRGENFGGDFRVNLLSLRYFPFTTC